MRLFSGDHVMGWSTTVVVPPDGDMADYMASLDKLRQRGDRILYPAHGPPVTNPAPISPPFDRPPDAAREADFAASSARGRGPFRKSSPRPIQGSIRGWSWPPALRCSRISWTSNGADSLKGRESNGPAAENPALVEAARDPRRDRDGAADRDRGHSDPRDQARQPGDRRSDARDDRHREPAIDARAEPPQRRSPRAMFRSPAARPAASVSRPSAP